MSIERRAKIKGQESDPSIGSEPVTPRMRKTREELDEIRKMRQLIAIGRALDKVTIREDVSRPLFRRESNNKLEGFDWDISAP